MSGSLFEINRRFGTSRKLLIGRGWIFWFFSTVINYTNNERCCDSRGLTDELPAIGKKIFLP